MIQTWFRRFGAVGFVFLVVALSGGCSGGCSGCGGTALTDGFPIASDTENGASIRVTSQGLGFINTNLPTLASKIVGGADGGGVLAFPIPDTPENITVGTATICGGTPTAAQCVADIDLAHMNLPITFSAPHDVKINGTIPIKVADLPIALSSFGVSICTVDMGIGANPSCNGNTPVVDYLDLPLTVDISIATDQTAGQVRTGYSAITISSLTVSLDSSNIKACGGGACGSAFNDLTFLVTFLQSTLEGEVKTQLENALCVKANDTDAGAGVDSGIAACPTGSNDVSGICRYGTSSTSACVSTLIGLDGHEDLSSLLSGISPGTQGGFDFALAAGGPDQRTDGTGQTWGDLNPIDGGMTLSMVGGSLPKPQTSCVPAFTNTIPTGVPVPDEMMGNALTPWPAGDKGPDLGIALAGRFLDYLFGGLYNAGTLCLGISTENFSQLQSGLLSVLIPSIKDLTFEQKAAAAAVTTRPQKPPTVKIGGGTDIKTDPLLTITLPQFALDFYVWSDDRYVRAMTYTADLSIPINLSTHVDPTTNPTGGLLPVLGNIGVANASVTNNALLTDDPTAVAAALTSLLGGIAGQLLGSIKPIDLSSALSSYGLAITIPDGAIRKLTKGTDDYIGLFADFSLNGASATRMADVKATIVDKKVFPEAMSLTTANRAKLPVLHVVLTSSFDDPTLEYSYAIDRGTHSDWAPSRDFTISNDALFLQGKHVLNVWARLHGQPASETTAPTQVPFIIDVLPPTINLSVGSDGTVAVDAWDLVSDTSALQMRTRANAANGAAAEWSAWGPVANVAANAVPNASSLDVQVRDEEENVGSVSSALIRGRADSTLTAAGGGCGSCKVAGTRDDDSSSSFALVLGGLAMLFVRRRKP